MILLSFCIPIMNRKYQLEKTLLKNINDSCMDTTEFILCNFSSNDGLHEYIINNFEHYIVSGKLKYYQIDTLKYWHASIAKNTTHSYANGKYVVNLDCDNFIGENGDKFVLDIFEKYGDMIIFTQNDMMYGTGNTGRIALLKENFKILGGYNESFYPMGYQDTDLVKRCVKYGLQNINMNSHNNAILNTKEESVKYIGINISYEKMNHMNALMSKINIDNNFLITNIWKNN